MNKTPTWQVCLSAEGMRCYSISNTAGTEVVCLKAGAGKADNL